MPAVTEGSTNVLRELLGDPRKFVYVVSEQLGPAAGRPLVIYLHVDGGNMWLSDAWQDAVLNDANAAVLLTPQSRNNLPEVHNVAGDTAWRFRMDEATEPYDDINFIQQLVKKATNDDAFLGAHINPDQVYAVGESRGAGMAYYLYTDPRTRDLISAIVALSGTFYCDGDATDQGTPAAAVVPGSDLECGELSDFKFWGPKPGLFQRARPAHILAIHGQLPSHGGEGAETAPPLLDVSWKASTWVGWAVAAGCDAEFVRSDTEVTLPDPVDGKAVKTYAFSQDAAHRDKRYGTLDLRFYVVQGGPHVPRGFERIAWCFLSSVGGTPSAHAC